MVKVPRKAIWKQLITLIPVYQTLFLIGCSGGWLTNAVYFLVEDKSGKRHATSPQCALIATFMMLGKVLFAIPAGMLTDKYGRKKIIICVVVLFVLINSAICLNYSMITIYVSRFIGGLAEAMVFATSVITIGEISSPEIRGQFTTVGLIILNIGTISPSIISVIFPSYEALTWGVMILSVMGLIPLLWVTETPHFLVSVSKLEQAKDFLQRIRPDYPENEINDEFEKLVVYVEDEKTRKSEITWLKFIKSKSVRKPMLIGALMYVFTGLIGIIAVKLYIAEIIPSNNFVPKKFYPLISQMVSFVMSICTTFYIDRFPRRALYLFGTMVISSAIAISAVASYFMAENQYGDTFKWVFTSGNILLLLFYDASVHPLNHIITAEIYPQAVKGLCRALGFIAETTSCAVVLQLYNIATKYSLIYVLYVVFLASALFLIPIAYFLLPESRGVLLSDLQREFGGGTASTVPSEVTSESPQDENLIDSSNDGQMGNESEQLKNYF